MTEDGFFNEFLRAKLEEEVGVIPAVTLPVAGWRMPFRRRSFRFLLAASIAVVCCAFAVLFVWDGDQERECDAAQVIAFLEACRNGEEPEADEGVEAVNFGERLLAWQDAPYYETLDDVFETCAADFDPFTDVNGSF